MSTIRTGRERGSTPVPTSYIAPKNGTDYDALSKNNPYENYQYTEGFWDHLGNWANNLLGFNLFKTPKQQYADEMANRANVYRSQIGEVQREEMYNSPEAQAARMRAAGINPDLESSGITGGQASEFDNQADAGLPDMSNSEIENQMRFAAGVFQKVSSIPTTIMSMLDSGLNLANKLADYSDKNTKLWTSMNDVATEMLNDMAVKNGGIDYLQNITPTELMNKFMNDPRIKAAFPLYSQRRKFCMAAVQRSRSMITGTSINENRGKFLKSDTDPMNHDEELIGLTATWQATYNQFRLENLSRYEKYLSENNAPEEEGKAKMSEIALRQLEADNKFMVQAGLSTLAEHYSLLYDETNDTRFAYGYMLAQQILNGEVEKYYKMLALSKADALVSDVTNPDNQNGAGVAGGIKTVVGNVADRLGVSTNGVGTDNDQNTVEPEEITPDSPQYQFWKAQGKSNPRGGNGPSEPYTDENRNPIQRWIDKWNERLNKRYQNIPSITPFKRRLNNANRQRQRAKRFLFPNTSRGGGLR